MRNLQRIWHSLFPSLHSWSDWQDVPQEACLQVRFCTVCGENEYQANHDYEVIETIEGYDSEVNWSSEETVYRCRQCGTEHREFKWY